MEPVEEKKSSRLSLYVTAAVYVLFNLRIAADIPSSVWATVKQIALTAPYVIGITLIVVSVIQYVNGGATIPWIARLRLLFSIGIFAGLVYGIYDYTGAATVPQVP